MEASGGSDESLMNSFEKISFEELMTATVPYTPEGEILCLVCYCPYKDDYERNIWTVSMELEDESMCNNCQIEQWNKFQEILKDTAEKHGFVIVKKETECFERGQEVLPAEITASGGSEESLTNSFEKIGFGDLMTASLPYTPEFTGESQCLVCCCSYKDYERDIWTVSMKLGDESMCNNCQLFKWEMFNEIIKDTADKHGFVIVKKECFERGQEVLPAITVGLPLPKDIPEKMKKMEEKNASTKADRPLTYHEGNGATKKTK